MKRILFLFIVFTSATILLSDLYSDTPKELGKISDLTGPAGITIHAPGAAETIKMGDKLCVIMQGKAVVLEASFPMMTSVKCRLSGSSVKMYSVLKKGMPVYRYKPGIEKDFADTIAEKIEDKSGGMFTGEIFTDSRDSKKYKTVKIGAQIWLAENLAYKAEGSKCYQSNEDFCSKYGRLYKWETAITACPKGWHLPSEDEWSVLMTTSGNLAPLLDKGSTKFNILMAGYCSYTGSFSNEGTNFYFWSSTEFAEDKTRARLRWNLSNDTLQIATDIKTQNYSVRCLYDK